MHSNGGSDQSLLKIKFLNYNFILVFHDYETEIPVLNVQII